MREIHKLAIVALGSAFLATTAFADTGGVKVGTLVCHVGEGWGYVLGSSKDIACDYRPNRGETDHYVGTLSKFGVDIGYTRGATLVWAVIAPTSDVGAGALQGDYAGATASATIGGGIGANVLLGGFDKSIALQPVSIEGNTGYIDVSAGVGDMSLEAVRPAAQRVSDVMPSAPPPAHFAVFFDFNRASLTREGQSIVRDAVRTAEQTGMVKVRIVGHTDTVGSESYNMRLSVKRAEAVKEAMVDDGMRATQIAIEGRGFHDPLVPTGPGVREPQNRRAVIDLGNTTVSER